MFLCLFPLNFSHQQLNLIDREAVAYGQLLVVEKLIKEKGMVAYAGAQ